MRGRRGPVLKTTRDSLDAARPGPALARGVEVCRRSRAHLIRLAPPLPTGRSCLLHPPTASSRRDVHAPPRLPSETCHCGLDKQKRPVRHSAPARALYPIMEPSAHVDLLDSSSSSSELSSALSSPSPPSSPLSILSHSPSPPPALPRARAYPSPPASQQTSNYGSPTPDGSDLARHADEDIMPPAKRRRVSKERITETLNLRCGDVKPEDQPPLDRLLSVLHKRRKIVVIAGAGISVAAGSQSPPTPVLILLVARAC